MGVDLSELDLSEHVYELAASIARLHVRRQAGRRIPVELVAKMMHYRGQEQRMVRVRDITARKQAQERIEFLALHDALAELPNRLLLNVYLPRRARSRPFRWPDRGSGYSSRPCASCHCAKDMSG